MHVYTSKVKLQRVFYASHSKLALSRWLTNQMVKRRIVQPGYKHSTNRSSVR